jgi:hypothetical protein
MRSQKRKKIQNLVIMLCRVGWGPRFEIGENEDWNIDIQPKVLEDRIYDGVMFMLDKEHSDLVRQSFLLPDDTKVCAGSYYGQAWTKGLILLDREENAVCTESVKLGYWGDTLDLSKLIIHEMDSLALSTSKTERLDAGEPDQDTQELKICPGKRYYAGINLGQEWVYCFNKIEQEIMLEKVFLPAVERAGTLSERIHALQECDKLLALGATVNDIKTHKVRDRLREWTLRAALNAPIPGLYVIFTPDAELQDFQIKVPHKAQYNGIKPGDKICVTRHPMLPLGNGTQVYTVVGYTDGNYAAVGEHPWMDIQGGDFDGDLGRISKYLHDLFPN